MIILYVYYRKRHHKTKSFDEPTHTGSDFVMTNPTYTSTQQFRVKLEPSSTLKVKDADAIEMQGFSHGSSHDGELIVVCLINIWNFSFYNYFIVHNT